jgi:hypothetical protein
MKRKEAERLAEKLTKVCMRSLTSKSYQSPPLSKGDALIKTTEIMLFYWEAVESLIKEEQ